MLLTKKARIKWFGATKQYYVDKGYIYTKMNDYFEVDIKDLKDGSNIRVDVRCDTDGCNVVKNIQWAYYLTCIDEERKYYCPKCSRDKTPIKNKKQKVIRRNKISFEQWCINNKREDIFKRWDNKLNNCKPNEVNFKSSKKYYFKCPRRLHKSELKIINDITRQNQKVICNYCNSFEQWCLDIDRQDLLDRWDYDLNKCNPNEVPHATGKRYYFKCPRGIHDSELKNLHSFSTGQIDFICLSCNTIAQWGIDNIGLGFLEKYWDYEKNNKLGIDPWVVTYGSDIKVWLKCKEKDYHGSYPVECSKLTRQGCNGLGCPYCGNNKTHILDSLGILRPEIFKVWSIKNKSSPYKYSYGSTKEAWWKCENNIHKDYKRIINRSVSVNFRCPDCVRERDESFIQEKVRLHIESLGYTILHEHKCTIVPINPKLKTNNHLPFDNEIVELKLIIEVMGKQHYEIGKWYKTEDDLHKRKLYDRYKRMYAKSKGYNYIDIPYWTDDKNNTYIKIINDKVNELESIKLPP